MLRALASRAAADDQLGAALRTRLPRNSRLRWRYRVEYLFHQPISPVRKAGIDLDEIRARTQGAQGMIGADDAADSNDGKLRTQRRAHLPDDAQGQRMQRRAAQSAALRVGPVGAEAAQV